MYAFVKPVISGFVARIMPTEGGFTQLVVSGEVETLGSMQVPILWVDETQIPTSRSLILNLSIRSLGGVGDDVTALRPVSFSYPARLREFTKVSVCWNWDPLVTLDVVARDADRLAYS